MNETALIVMTLALAGVVLLLVGPFSVKGLVWARTHKEPTFFGADFFYSSPSQIVHKYKLKMYAAPWVGGGTRPGTMVVNLGGMFLLLYKSLTGRGYGVPAKFYYWWCAAWIVSIGWVFIFDWEMQVLVSAITLLLHVTACVTLHTGCQFYDRVVYGKAKAKEVPGSLFRYLVLEGLALLCTWSFPAFTMSFATMLAYKSSLHSDVAIPTGLLTPDDAATIGLVCVLVRFLIWWIFDVTYWGKCSDSINAVYPTLAIITFSITTNNYDSEHGMTVNNILSLTVSILSVVAFLTRKMTKEYFLENRKSTRSHQD